MIAATRIGATFHESDSDSIAMIVIEGQHPLGADAHRYYDDLVTRLAADHRHVQHVQNVWGDPLTAAGCAKQRRQSGLCRAQPSR